MLPKEYRRVFVGAHWDAVLFASFPIITRDIIKIRILRAIVMVCCIAFWIVGKLTTDFDSRFDWWARRGPKRGIQHRVEMNQGIWKMRDQNARNLKLHTYSCWRSRNLRFANPLSAVVPCGLALNVLPIVSTAASYSCNTSVLFCVTDDTQNERR